MKKSALKAILVTGVVSEDEFVSIRHQLHYTGLLSKRCDSHIVFGLLLHYNATIRYTTLWQSLWKSRRSGGKLQRSKSMCCSVIASRLPALALLQNQWRNIWHLNLLLYNCLPQCHFAQKQIIINKIVSSANTMSRKFHFILHEWNCGAKLCGGSVTTRIGVKINKLPYNSVREIEKAATDRTFQIQHLYM